MKQTKKECDHGESYLERFKYRIHRNKLKIGENPNKFDPNMVREGNGVLAKSPDKNNVHTDHKTVAYHSKPTPASQLSEKPWYMLTFAEVIEVNCPKKPPKKKPKVPHPGFGSSSKSRIDLTSQTTPDKTTGKIESTISVASPKKTIPIDPKVAFEIEAAAVKNRRLKVSHLEA